MPPATFTHSELDPQPKNPIILGAPGVRDYRATVEMPKGDVVTVPADVDIVTSFAEYRESASVTDGVLSAQRIFTVKQAKIPADQWNAYLKFEKAVQARENLWIQVAGGNGTLPATGTTDVPAARDLINQAYQALRQQNKSEAKPELDQAKLLNPAQYGLWATYSMLYMQQNKPDQALDAFHKEIANHPENLWAYRYMSAEMASLNRPADVEQVWLSLLKHDPASTDGTLGLARVFMHEKRYNEAIVLLKQATHAKDASPNIQTTLGTDELEAGQKDAGIADLQPIMRTSQDPETVNDVAYILADHEADLPEAAQYAANALQQIEKSTAAIQLATLSQHDLAQISLLAATWDTVGWIDFKQAKYPDAERYIRAAWLLGHPPAVADHLRQVYEKEGKLDEARHIQKLSENVLEIQKLRTIEISGLPKITASAQFWLVITPQGLEEVKMITGDVTLSHAADLLKKRDYPQTFPDPGPVKIVRRGVLSCSQFTPSCELVLLQPQWTRM